MRRVFTLLLPVVWLMLAGNAPLCAGSLEDVQCLVSPEGATVTLLLHSPAQPQVRFLPRNSCWQIDLIGFENRSSFSGLAARDGPLQLVHLEQIKQRPAIFRMSCHVRRGVVMKCLLNGRTVNLAFRFSAHRRELAGGQEVRTPQPLLLPKSDHGEMVIKVKNTPLEPVIAELSRQALPGLKFRDVLPGKVTLNRTFPDAQAALEGVLAHCGYVLTQEAEGWFVSRQSNPLLQIPGNNEIYWKPLAGLPVRDCLSRVLGENEEVIRGAIPEGVLEEKFPDLEMVSSSRRWVESLMTSHGLQFKEGKAGA